MRNIADLLSSLDIDPLATFGEVVTALSKTPSDFTVKHKPVRVKRAVGYIDAYEVSEEFETVVTVDYRNPYGDGKLIIHFTELGRMVWAEYKTSERVVF